MRSETSIRPEGRAVSISTRNMADLCMSLFPKALEMVSLLPLSRNAGCLRDWGRVRGHAIQFGAKPQQRFSSQDQLRCSVPICPLPEAAHPFQNPWHQSSFTHMKVLADEAASIRNPTVGATKWFCHGLASAFEPLSTCFG